MKSKNLLLCVLSTSFLVSCGQNAFLEQSTKSLKNSSVTSVSNKVKQNQNLTVQEGLSIHTEHINLGNIIVGSQRIVPIIITNDGSQNIDDYRLSPCDVSEFNRLDDGKISAGDQETFYISLNVDTQGAFTKDATLYYKSGEQVGETTVKISGVGVDSMSSQSSDLRLGVSSQENLNFGKIPVASSSIIDVALEKLVINGATSLISSMRFQNDNVAFSLTKDSSECSKGIETSCSIGVIYKPSVDQVDTDVLIISYLDAASKTQTISIKLSGEGISSNECIQERVELQLPKEKSSYSDVERNIELPYYETSSKTNKSLYAVTNDEFNKTYSNGDSVVEYIQDGQVVLSYDTAKFSGKDISSVDLSVAMIKSFGHSQRFEKTEVLCLSNQKLCSGQRFVDSVYSKHINYDYTVVNDHFSEILVKSKNKKMIASKKFYTFDQDLSFDEMFMGKTEQIYKGISEQSTLPMILADDIKLAKLPYLKVKYKKVIDANNSCK